MTHWKGSGILQDSNMVKIEPRLQRFKNGKRPYSSTRDAIDYQEH